MVIFQWSLCFATSMGYFIVTQSMREPQGLFWVKVPLSRSTTMRHFPGKFPSQSSTKSKIRLLMQLKQRSLIFLKRSRYK